MKKKLFFSVFLMLAWLTIAADQLSSAPQKYTRHTSHRQLASRKFSTAALFQNLANTCTHAGKVSAAQTQEEKQQAACNLLASVFQTAADLSQKNNKENLKKSPNSNAPVELTITLFNALELSALFGASPLDQNTAELAAEHPVLVQLAGLPTDDDRRMALTTLLATDQGQADLVKEISWMLEALIMIKAPAISSAFSSAISNLPMENQ